MMTVEVWVVSTCIPEENEPCLPCVFGTEKEALDYLDRVMRAEWGSYGVEDRETGELLAYPEHDPIAAQELIAAGFTDGSWGRWAISSHTIETTRRIKAELNAMLKAK